MTYAIEKQIGDGSWVRYDKTLADFNTACSYLIGCDISASVPKRLVSLATGQIIFHGKYPPRAANVWDMPEHDQGR